jgi:hypothetical protein
MKQEREKTRKRKREKNNRKTRGTGEAKQKIRAGRVIGGQNERETWGNRKTKK